MPERSFATSTFISPPKATMFPSWTRTMVSVSLIELLARGSVVSAALATPPKLNVRSCCTTLLTSGWICRRIFPSSSICGVMSRDTPEKNELRVGVNWMAMT